MRFLGNKTRMLSNIQFVMDENNITGEVFCDLFAGSGSVGDFFKGKFKVISNDYLYSLSVINKAKLSNKTVPTFSKFMEKFGKNPFDYFNAKTYIADSQYFIANNYSPIGGRQFFSTENAVKIDGIRIEIETLYKDFILSAKEREFLLASLIESVMGVSNTTGTYESFLKHWDKDTVFYFDPPYFITNATYNDGKRGFIGWDADEETKLLDFIADLNLRGFKFVLSNVIYHNDETNHLLVEWIKTHNFNVKNIDNVGSKNSRDEVLITNYDWREIK